MKGNDLLTVWIPFSLEAYGKVMRFHKMISVFSATLLVCICSSFWLMQPLTARTWESLPAAGKGIWNIWECAHIDLCVRRLAAQTLWVSSCMWSRLESPEFHLFFSHCIRMVLSEHLWVSEFPMWLSKTSDKAKAIIKLYLFFPADLIHCS